MCQEETKYGVLQNLLQILQNALKYIMIYMKQFYNSKRNKNGSKKYKITLDVPKLSFIYLEKIN